ncbi:hypothetical protein Acr_09g0004090 [Actinidia rufa]|uniref:Uncharacterized protein n=1 Tax=Actinidia rufa TaxID=165716 RepID=A0A7J0F5S9_9ERIC|nr:hypothetical protein Acr_09g0004090 [Actinidia rufa]
MCHRLSYSSYTQGQTTYRCRHQTPPPPFPSHVPPRPPPRGHAPPHHALSTSKATTQQKNTRSRSGGDQYHCGNKYYCYNTNISYHQDPHHSEAVADCIEFIKKSAANTPDESRDSIASDRGSAGGGLSGAGYVMY